MDGIPPARDTDAEDVVWALQTAEALWKRNERGDAIVWLRRAAQAAGETNDDDRALLLARSAAELTEGLAKASAASLPTVPPGSDPGSAGVDIDTLLRASQVDPAELAQGPVSLESDAIVSDRSPPIPQPVAPPPARTSERVLSAAESHAGMLAPWSEAPSSAPKPPVPVKRKDGPYGAPRVEIKPAPAPAAFDAEVVTSAGPLAPGGPATAPAEPAKPPARAPKPPPPPKTKSQQLPATPAPAPVAIVVLEPIDALDLSAVEAFADLPDDARDGLAKAAHLQRHTKGDALGAFGRVFMVNGDAHVMASGVPSPALTIGKGTVLRARGTLDSAIALDLACASESCVAATWAEEAVGDALGACPWVEDELRASADRVQAQAGATLGALGQRLSTELRASVVNRLTMRAFPASSSLEPGRWSSSSTASRRPT